MVSRSARARKGSKGRRARRMEKGSFSVEWLAQSSHEKAQPASGVSSTHHPPRGDRSLPKKAASASGDQEKGNPALTTPSTRSRKRPPEGARRSPGDQAALRELEETGPSSAASSPKEEEEAGGEGSGSESTSCTQPGRPRTKFSASQLQELERSFREQRYIGASEKRRLSKVLKLSQTQIKTWFQNRRMKFKRQTQDARVEALFSGLLLPYRYSEIQTPNYPPGMEFNVSSAAAVTCSLHPAMPTPALLLPPAPTQSLQPVVPTPALLVSAAPGFSYQSTIPTVSLTQDHNRLRFQPYLPPS
ncbi:homeobox protein vex1-like [Malaclemys terrapin pileata]|uniref:homeobox protein vex1-like n=1 Tax=Malaclemys terrapin pileata TaxID=2991368 RepID=UPI0023A7F9EE|nr:homeobox protein vex1-like [Malaclemys terrapin pileata]